MQRIGAVHPYREAPELVSNDEPTPRVSDESVFITALLVLGGIRVLVAALAGKWLEAEVTLAAFLLAAGVVWGCVEPGVVHDGGGVDRARCTVAETRAGLASARATQCLAWRAFPKAGVP